MILKNIEKDNLKWWLKNNFKETIDPWSQYSFRDDNSFPQYNLTAAVIKEFKFGRHLRHIVRSFNRQRKIATEFYDSKHNEAAQKLLKEFALYAEAKGTDSALEIERGHQFFFDFSIKKAVRLQHIQNGHLLGFSFLTPVGETIFYNLVICQNESNLMKYLMCQSFNFILQLYPQVETFGIQGSENAGQDYFKKRFKPSEIIEKTHLIYNSLF